MNLEKSFVIFQTDIFRKKHYLEVSFMKSSLSRLKVLTVSLAFFLIMTSPFGDAFADPTPAFSIAEGNIIIAPGVGDEAGKVAITWGTTPSTAYFEPDTSIVITGTTTQYSVSVTGGVNANLMLEDLTINLSAAGTVAPVSIAGNSSVSMIVNGQNQLVARSSGSNAGLQVNSGNALTILAASSGELTAIGGTDGAGIGGGNAAGGSITINGGTIYATGGYNGAGIGGGRGSYGGTIIINGGVVVARGTVEGPGIGGGYPYGTQPSAVVQLNGGDITAISGSCGPAAIGGPCLGGAADITILSTATVRAVSRSSGKALQPIGNTLNTNSTASVLLANYSAAKASGTLTEVLTQDLAAVIQAAPATPSTYQSIAFTVPASDTYLLRTAGKYQRHTSTDFVIGGAGLYIFNTVQDAPEKANQTITFSALPGKTYGDADFSPAATASSGLTVTYSSSNTDVAVIVNNQVRIVGSGTSTITAYQEGNSSYNAATPISHTLSVSQKELVLTSFTADDKIYDGTTAATGSFTTNAIAGDVVVVLYTANFDTKDAGENKTVSFTGLHLQTGGDNDNYTITTTTGSATAKITKRPLSITLLDKSKNYGQLDPVFEASYNSTEFGGMGFGAGDDVTTLGNLRIYRLQGNDVGSYPIRYQIFDEKNHNYIITMIEGTFTIEPKAITISNLSANDKIYDGTTDATGTITISGILLEDDVQAAGTFTFVDKNAGASKALNVTEITLTGDSRNNYTIAATASTTATISKRSLDLSSFTAGGKVYDSTDAVDVTGFTDNRLGSDELSFTYTARFASKHAGVDKEVYFTNIAISGGKDKDNYVLSVTSGTAIASILKKELTATAIADNKLYDGTRAGTGTISVAGKIAGDDLDAGGLASFEFEDKNVGNNKKVTVTNIILSGADKENYTVTSLVETTASIGKRELKMIAENKSKLYGNSFDPKFTVSWEGFQNEETESDLGGSYTIFREVGESAGLYDIWIINSLTSTNYNIQVFDGNNNDGMTYGTFTIEKIALTITAESAAKTYDGTALQAGGWTYAGTIADGETLQSPMLTGSQLFVGSSDNVASGAIIKNGATDVTSNYDITYVPGTLTINQASIPITVTSAGGTKAYDGTALTNAGSSLTSGNLATGDALDVTVSGSITNVGTTANTISEVKVLHGTEDVTENYVITTSTGTLEVSKRAVTITAASDSKVYDGTALTTSDSRVTTGTLLSGHSYTANVSGSQLFVGSSASSVSGASILDDSNDNVTGNYNITYISGVLTIDRASIAIHVTADSTNKIYDGTVLEAGYTSTGTLATNDSLSVSFSGSITNVGTTANTITEVKVLHGTEQVDVTENYDITTSAGILTIQKKELTASVGDYTKTYGDNNPTFVVEVTGFVNGETRETALDYNAPTASSTATSTTDVGSYDITISGGAAANYSFDYNVGTLAVNARLITVTSNNKTKYEGHNDPDLTYAITSGDLLGGDSLSVVLVREKGEAVGSYSILKESITISENYAVTYIPGTFVIRSTPSVVSPPSSTTPQKDTDNIIVTVNGESTSAGTETKTILDGKTTTLIQVNNEVVESKIEEAVKNNATGVGNNIQITSADIGSEVVAFELKGDTVKKLEQNGFNVSVKNNDIAYNIPAKEFNISKVAEALNISESDLKEIKVAVRITKLDDQIIKQYNQVAKDNGVELIFSPVTFEVVANTTRADGSTGEVIISKFSSYVERVMEIPEGVDPSKITTGIVFNQDGTYSHVPTSVFQNDGKWYARINSLTNSTYAVIWNPITVASVENHWSKAIVNDMASRLVIKNPETFMPNQNITRGEFAEYITKALGIHRAGITVTKKFADVETTHELSFAIELATAYGIINGYPDGSFKPDAQISREEAMVMYSRAMDIVGLKEIDNGRIETYIDKELVAEWAYNHVKKTVSAGVFNGKTSETINPKDTFTNAEAATAIRNLLIASGLINK
jgi:hypothetical protein